MGIDGMDVFCEGLEVMVYVLPQFGIRIVYKKVGSLTNILYLLPLHPIIELTSGNRSEAYFS